jgi:ParB/RepB/Spo0J family partition protein
MTPQLLRLELDSVAPDPTQPRKNFDPEAHRELKRTLAERGQLVPASVRRVGEGAWVLADGERRWRALSELHAEQPDNPAFATLAAIEVEIAEKDLLLVQYITNQQREPHTVTEKTLVIERLRAAGHAEDALPGLLGMSRGEYRYLRQFAGAPDWLKAYGNRVQVKRPVPDETTGEPKLDEDGKPRTHAWTFEPLPLSHLIELTKLAARLTRDDERRAAAARGRAPKPQAERITRRLADQAVVEGLGHQQLKTEVARLLRRLDGGGAGESDQSADDPAAPVADAPAAPPAALSALSRLPREGQLAALRALLVALGLSPQDLAVPD